MNQKAELERLADEHRKLKALVAESRKGKLHIMKDRLFGASPVGDANDYADELVIGIFFFSFLVFFSNLPNFFCFFIFSICSSYGCARD